MATGINGIGTVGELVSKGLFAPSELSDSDCPNKSIITSQMKGAVNGDYSDVQLPKYSDVSSTVLFHDGFMYLDNYLYEDSYLLTT